MTASPASDADGGQPKADMGGQPKGKYRGRRIVMIVVSVALFAAILWFGGVESWQAVLSGDPVLYLLAFVLSGIVPALSAWRLGTLVRTATGNEVACWRRFFHINMTAMCLGLFLPRNAALLGGKAAYLRTLGVPVLRGSWAVLMENLVDVLFLAVMVVPCGFVLVAGVGPGGFLVSIVASIAALFAMALWTHQRDWRAFAGSLVKRVPWIYRRLPSPEGGFVPGPMRAVPLLGVTTAIHVSLALRAYVIALAIGLEACGWRIANQPRNLLRLSSLVILGVVARMFRCATRSSCWCT